MILHLHSFGAFTRAGGGFAVTSLGALLLRVPPWVGWLGIDTQGIANHLSAFIGVLSADLSFDTFTDTTLIAGSVTTVKRRLRKIQVLGFVEGWGFLRNSHLSGLRMIEGFLTGWLSAFAASFDLDVEKARVFGIYVHLRDQIITPDTDLVNTLVFDLSNHLLLAWHLELPLWFLRLERPFAQLAVRLFGGGLLVDSFEALIKLLAWLGIQLLASTAIAENARQISRFGFLSTSCLLLACILFELVVLTLLFCG